MILGGEVTKLQKKEGGGRKEGEKKRRREREKKEGRERKKGRERVRERNLCMNYENYHQFPGGKKERNMLIIPQRFRN